MLLYTAAQMSTPGDFAVPGSRFYTISRPSDYMLTHLKRFAEEDVTRGIHWAAVLESTVKVRTAIVKSCFCILCLALSNTSSSCAYFEWAFVLRGCSLADRAAAHACRIRYAVRLSA